MATLDTTTNPSDKVEQQANTRGDRTRTGRRVQNAYYQRYKMNKPELSIARLEASLDAKISTL
jgi:hypothetical protein